jgi:hypothetical protein
MRERRAIAGAIIGSVACVGAAWGFLASQSGCQLQTCIPSTLYVGSDAGANQPFQTGAGVYNGVWQSGVIDGNPADPSTGWMSFPAQITYLVHPLLPDGGLFPGPYIPTNVLVSPDPFPNSGSNFAPSAGNIAEFSSDVGTNGISVFNDTCSNYYLWFQLEQESPQPDAASSPLDASADGPTSAPSDASPDASLPDASDASIPAPDASNADATGD